MSTNLADKMRELADGGHDRAPALRVLADKFDDAADAFYAEPQRMDVKRFMGHYARARMLWCACSGEPLV